MSKYWEEYDNEATVAPRKDVRRKGKQKKETDEEALARKGKRNRFDKKNAERAPWKKDSF